MAKLTVRQTVLFGILGALTFAGKYVMQGLPNIEPVSLMIMLFAVTFGLKGIYPMYVYVVMEFLFYGLNTWSVCYLYIWLVLLLLALAFRKMEGALGWALLSGVFGLGFGALCTPVDVVMGGFGWRIYSCCGFGRCPERSRSECGGNKTNLRGCVCPRSNGRRYSHNGRYREKA